ncbi:hypothetical protein DJ511_27260 [Klebsiella pneumoniae]|nr:hypothetical protein DJ511_27260 [Klebsiella pneumoniae]
MVGDFHPLIFTGLPAHTVFITSIVTLFFFKSRQNGKLIKLLLLPVRGTSFTVFENSQCF